jgi:NAD(P)-dependent dehydrogenase (short-subunit alcohol dehydrogenase family)
MPSISRSSGLSSRAAISSWFWASVAMGLPSRLLRAVERDRIFPHVRESPRAALITGGTGRVGSAIAKRLEAEGFAVLAAGRRDGDITRPEEARALVERAAQELGGLDLLVNAASGGFDPRPVEEVSEDDWDAALDSTAKGTFFVTQAAVPHLRASSLGLVVTIEDVGAYSP